MKRKFVFLLMLLMPAIAWAGDAPDVDTIKRVLDYYHNGSSVTLVEYKFCSEIVKEGENKNECADSVDAAAIEKGNKTYLWMNFLVPGDDTEKTNVLVQYIRKGMAMKTSEIHMPQSMRYRTWRLLPTQKADTWSVSISQEAKAGYEKIGNIDFTVVEPAAAASDMN